MIAKELLKERLKNEKKVYRDINLIITNLSIPAAQAKDIAFQLKGEYEKVIFIAGGVNAGKPHLTGIQQIGRAHV